MPTNKNAQLRYQILDRCFSDFHRKYEIDDLLDKVNEALMDLYGTEVSLRQIRDDIKYMRDRVTYNAPIKAYPFDGKKCFYRYEVENYTIFNNALTVEEVSKLRSTIEMLQRYRGIPSYAWLEEIISNLEFRFGVKSNRENIISFEQNDNLKGLEFLPKIIDAAVNHQPFEIHYLSFKGKETISIMHPYHIKQFNNRWFLFGMEEFNGKKQISNRALDRIIKITLRNIPFVENTFIDFSNHFDNIVGVTHPMESIKEETVILQFDKERFPYVVNKPIHHTQKVLDNESCTLSIFVRPNKELESRIFSYGPQVEVLSPDWFRQQISKKIEENYKKYFPMQKDCTDIGEFCTRKQK